MRKESIDEKEGAEIREILHHVTHVEGKYVATLKLLKERVQSLGAARPLILHAQYDTHGEDILNMVSPDFRDKLGDKFDCVCNPEIMVALVYALNDCDEDVRKEAADEIGRRDDLDASGFPHQFDCAGIDHRDIGDIAER